MCKLLRDFALLCWKSWGMGHFEGDRCVLCSQHQVQPLFLLVSSSLLSVTLLFVAHCFWRKLALNPSETPMSLNCRWLLLAPAATLALDYFHMGLCKGVVVIYWFLPQAPASNHNNLKSIRPPIGCSSIGNYNCVEHFTSKINYALFLPS